MNNIPVVILCGGQGTRLREETEFKPKPLVSVGDKPILWHIMKIYSHYGFNNFILCLGYKGDLIKRYFLDYKLNNDIALELKSGNVKIHENTHKTEDWNITFANTGLNAQSGARIKKIEKYIETDTFFITYGDGVADIDINKLLEFHRSHQKIGTVTTVRPKTRFGNLKLSEDDSVLDFTKKTIPHEGWIDGGFFVFNKRLFDYLDENDSCMLEGEPLRKLAYDNEFKAYKHGGFWQCMDTHRDFLNLNKLWYEEGPWRVWND